VRGAMLTVLSALFPGGFPLSALARRSVALCSLALCSLPLGILIYVFVLRASTCTLTGTCNTRPTHPPSRVLILFSGLASRCHGT